MSEERKKTIRAVRSLFDAACDLMGDEGARLRNAVDGTAKTAMRALGADGQEAIKRGDLLRVGAEIVRNAKSTKATAGGKKKRSERYTLDRDGEGWALIDNRPTDKGDDGNDTRPILIEQFDASEHEHAKKVLDHYRHWRTKGADVDDVDPL